MSASFKAADSQMVLIYQHPTLPVGGAVSVLGWVFGPGLAYLWPSSFTLVQAMVVGRQQRGRLEKGKAQMGWGTNIY